MRSAAMLLLLGASAGAQGIESLRWLEGCWELRIGSRATAETWRTLGPTLIGTSRTIVNGTVTAVQRAQIKQTASALTYTLTTATRPPVEFTADGAATGDSVVFANPQHDFPQRIVYRRIGGDSLVARAEGATSTGSLRQVIDPYRRVSCVP